jgi:hypothetical protein
LPFRGLAPAAVDLFQEAVHVRHRLPLPGIGRLAFSDGWPALKGLAVVVGAAEEAAEDPHRLDDHHNQQQGFKTHVLLRFLIRKHKPEAPAKDHLASLLRWRLRLVSGDT